MLIRWLLLGLLVQVGCSSAVLNTSLEYIVMFKSYMSHKEHHTLLKDALFGLDGQWNLIKRNNPGSAFPSDFALVSVTTPSILNVLEHLSIVKYIVPQRRIVNPLQMFKVDSGAQEDATNQTDIPFGHGRYYGPGILNLNWTTESKSFPQSRKLQAQHQITDLFNTHVMWEKGISGENVKVAIFDTGLRADHPHFRNVVQRTDWTAEKNPDDGLGHGTFVAGVIASQRECLGFAPNADLYIYRVFTNAPVSYTSWFLDAFNDALRKGIDVLNLSIGGPDFMDRPFVDKVLELSANKVTVISAIGNDGPLYGTLNNPADQLDVIGVGGIDFANKVADFSSRGMTTWELPSGYGRVKPEIMAYGNTVSGSRIDEGCRVLSGTSVASPVVTGVVSLLMGSIPQEQRKAIINPASIKQILLESAERVPGANIFEQGFGKIRLIEAYHALSQYTPRVSLIPWALDLTECPYMWPYCVTPLYHGAIPIIFNVTILNGIDLFSKIKSEPLWVPSAPHGDYVDVKFTYSEELWPWTGYLAVHLTVKPSGKNYEGVAEGVVYVNVTSEQGEEQSLRLPIRVKIVPTPPRHRRILFDLFHNLKYPSGYFPRDVLDKKEQYFDWNGDHPHTNLRSMHKHLLDLGYYVEMLGTPFTCFDATQYGTLFVFDPEEEFWPAEIEKLKQDVTERGLSVFVVADWYNVDVMKDKQRFDDNSQQMWTPATGGCNIPALNDLLFDFGILLGERVYDGNFVVDERTIEYMSGTSILLFPKNGTLVYASLQDQTTQILSGKKGETKSVPILGFYTPVTPAELQSDPKESIQMANHKSSPVNDTAAQNATQGKGSRKLAEVAEAQTLTKVVLQDKAKPGTIAVYGDSSCLDDAGGAVRCLWLLEAILRTISTGSAADFPSAVTLTQDMDSGAVVPKRMDGNNLVKYSKVISKTLQCPANAGFVWDDPRNITSKAWLERSIVILSRKQPPTSKPGSRGSSKAHLSTYVFFCFIVVFVGAVIFKNRRSIIYPGSPKRIAIV